MVDANAIAHGAWRLDSAAWRVLLYQSRSGAVTLIIPELVLREVVGRFSAALEKQMQDASRAAKNLEGLTGLKTTIMEATDPEQSSLQYESELRRKLNVSNVDIAPLPQVDLSSFVEKAISRRRPFDHNGAGFRDALLWEHAVELALTYPSARLLLISSDLRAFAESSQSRALHPDLSAELLERTGTMNLTLVDTVPSYLDQEGLGDPHLTAQVGEETEKQQARLVELAEQQLIGAELEGGLLFRASARLGHVADIAITLDGASGPAEDSQGLTLAKFTVRATARIELLLHDYATPIVRHAKVSLLMQASSAYDFERRSFENLDIDQIPEVVEELATDLSESSEAGETTFGRLQLSAALLEQLRNASLAAVNPALLEQISHLGDSQPPQRDAGEGEQDEADTEAATDDDA
jgi:PIN domain